MKVNSKNLHNTLSRAAQVIALKKHHIETEYEMARFECHGDSSMTVTATDGSFIAGISCPVREGEDVDVLVDIARLVPWSEYVVGEVTLNIQENKVLARCGRSQCSAKIAEGFFPLPNTEEKLGEVALDDLDLNVLTNVADSDPNATVNFQNVSLVLERDRVASIRMGAYLISSIEGAYSLNEKGKENGRMWLLPPKYLDVAAKVTREERFDLYEPNHVRVMGEDAWAIFTTVQGNSLNTAVSDLLYMEPEHIFPIDPIKDAIATLRKVAEEDVVFASVEQLEEGRFVVKQDFYDFQSIPFARVSGSDWKHTAVYNARLFLDAMSWIGDGAELQFTKFTGYNAYLAMLVNGTRRICLAPGGRPKKDKVEE